MTEGPPETTNRGPVRRLYEWVLRWADTPHGPRALGALSFAEASIFPIPPDPLLVALCLGEPRRALRFSAIVTVASVAGGAFGYAMGAAAWHFLEGFFFAYVPGVTEEAFERVRDLYARYDFWAVFVAGLTPIPYKVFTLSAGVFAINPLVFLAASVLSRGLRFFVAGLLIHRFGTSIRGFIDRYFNALAWLFAGLLLLGFAAIRFLH